MIRYHKKVFIEWEQTTPSYLHICILYIVLVQIGNATKNPRLTDTSDVRTSQLTANDFGHAAGGIDAADVFGVGGVGVIAEQERCSMEKNMKE